MTRRFPDWPKRFNAFLEQRRNVPFAWGTNDCALFVCDAIQVLSGIDPGVEFRGKYSDGIDALMVVREFLQTRGVELRPDSIDRLHLGQVAEVIAAEHEFAEVHPLKAQQGDVVLFDQPGHDYLTLGIVSDGWHIVIPGSQFQFNLRNGLRAWRIA